MRIRPAQSRLRRSLLQSPFAFRVTVDHQRARRWFHLEVRVEIPMTSGRDVDVSLSPFSSRLFALIKLYHRSVISNDCVRPIFQEPGEVFGAAAVGTIASDRSSRNDTGQYRSIERSIRCNARARSGG